MNRAQSSAVIPCDANNSGGYTALNPPASDGPVVGITKGGNDLDFTRSGEGVEKHSGGGSRGFWFGTGDFGGGSGVNLIAGGALGVYGGGGSADPTGSPSSKRESGGGAGGAANGGGGLGGGAKCVGRGAAAASGGGGPGGGA